MESKAEISFQESLGIYNVKEFPYVLIVDLDVFWTILRLLVISRLLILLVALFFIKVEVDLHVFYLDLTRWQQVPKGLLDECSLLDIWLLGSKVVWGHAWWHLGVHDILALKSMRINIYLFGYIHWCLAQIISIENGWGLIAKPTCIYPAIIAW